MVFQLALTAMAARSFDHATFSVWTLAISMAALTPLFAINLSSVVTRQLVGAAAHGSEDTQAIVVRAARRVARVLAVFALFAIAAASMLLYRRSPELAHASEVPFIIAVVALTVGQLWQILEQPSFGWHYAREHNWPVTGLYLSVRAGALLAMWIAVAAWTGSFLAASLLVAVGHYLGLVCAQLGFFAPAIVPIHRRIEYQHQVRETTHFALGFGIWSIAIAMIQYGLPPIMSMLRTPDYNAFYLAYSLNLVLAGILGSSGAALLAPLARMRVRGQQHLLTRYLTMATIACAVFMLCSLLGLRLGMGWIIRSWSAGIANVADVNGYLYMLGFQSLARLMAIPYASILSSTANPRQLVAPALVEVGLAAFIAVPAGIFMGSKFFLAILPVAGLASAFITQSVATRIGGFSAADRKSLFLRFCATEIVGLGLWQIAATRWAAS